MLSIYPLSFPWGFNSYVYDDFFLRACFLKSLAAKGQSLHLFEGLILGDWGDTRGDFGGQWRHAFDDWLGSFVFFCFKCIYIWLGGRSKQAPFHFWIATYVFFGIPQDGATRLTPVLL